MDPRQAKPELLLPDEAAALSRCVEKRRREYAAGRLLASQLLLQLGKARTPLLSDDQRVPRWPPGIIGCISHTDTWCAVAVADPMRAGNAATPDASAASASSEAGAVTALGIDVEQRSPLSSQLFESVCRPEELEVLKRTPRELRGHYAKVLFSAKESIYKALFPTQRKFLGFQGMHIELLLEGDVPAGFAATLMQPWGSLAAGSHFPGGRAYLTPKLICTAIAL